MTKRKIRILCSPTLLIGIIFSEIMALSLFIFMIAFEPCRQGITTHPVIYIFTLVYLGITFILISILFIRRFYTIITIDEKGISRSFLGRFYKLEIPWDNMKEVVFFTAIAEFIIFSKTKKVSTMPQNKMRAVKDTIELTLSKKRYDVIKQYLQQPIVGMPEKVKARLERAKKKA